MNNKSFIGLIGLGVMGENLALNIEFRGFKISVYNRTKEKLDKFKNTKAKGKNINITYSIQEFIDSLELPRKIILMVKAGEPCDKVIETLLPYLAKGDILIDGGNSFYKDTERRGTYLIQKGIYFIGCGISGGEEGARKGPSIMPGGELEAYKKVEPLLTAIAAQVSGEPCCTYIGPGGSGHFVKMVHNGIEYSDMQLIAECYDIMKRFLKFSIQETGKVFEKWNNGFLKSYLIEITGKIFKKVDSDTGGPLLELILDETQQKGTGKWTAITALDMGIPVPSIHNAVEARFLSSMRKLRLKAASIYETPVPEFKGDKEKFVKSLERALYFGKLISYAQGYSLLRQASIEYNWNLDLAAISRIWRGGCIIRAGFLNRIAEAYSKEPDLQSLLFASEFIEEVKAYQQDLREVVVEVLRAGVPVYGLAGAISYFDTLRTSRLPHNLLQAQRDFFGAHTYQRIDKEGIFHTNWEE